MKEREKIWKRKEMKLYNQTAWTARKIRKWKDRTENSKNREIQRWLKENVSSPIPNAKWEKEGKGNSR